MVIQPESSCRDVGIGQGLDINSGQVMKSLICEDWSLESYIWSDGDPAELFKDRGDVINLQQQDVRWGTAF